MTTGFIKVGNFKNGKHSQVRSVKTVEKHLKYIGFRSREMDGEQEHFFYATDDRANWRTFLEGIEKHPALQHSNTTKVHKLIFSLRKPDYEAYRMSGRDYRDVIRHVFKQMEERKGIKLDWIASRHDRNSEHPHCHVVLRAVTDKGTDGKSKRIFLSKEDIQTMKRDFNNEIGKYRVHEIEKSPLERSDLERSPMMGLFDQFAKAMERERLKREYEAEQEKSR